uniref:Uncharacterized protein n=1 Tax=Arundo donax TaxID=35708 RepID=A0A0A9FTW5_ARUDO
MYFNRARSTTSERTICYILSTEYTMPDRSVICCQKQINIL